MLALVFLVACSSSVAIAPTVSVTNSCKNNGDCAAYVQCSAPPCTTNNLSCVSGACIANGNLKSLARLQSAPYDTTTPFTLVVTMPDTSPFAGGSTLVFKNSDFVLAQPGNRAGQAPPCQGTSTTDTCIVVINNAEVVGDYETDQFTSETLLGVKLNASGRTSLPVHTTFRLLTDDPTTMTTQTSVGIPASPIFATVTSNLATSEPPSGPNGSAIVAWDSWLPVGRYQRQITVDPPFDAVFPPWFDFIDVTQPRSDQVRLAAPPEPGAPAASGTSIDNQANRTYTINAGSIPLTGWSAYIRNSTTGAIISSTTTFANLPVGASTSVTLNTVTPSLPPIPTPTDLTGDEIVIAPPPNVNYPTLIGAAIGGKIFSPQSYPPVPTPALVSGVVFAADANDASAPTKPISAWIDFISVPGPESLSQGTAQDLTNVDIRYRTSLHTAPDGTYSVTLPRGPYDIIITPDPSTGYAVTFLNHRVADDTVANSGDHLIQSGIGLPVNLPAQLSGHVTLTNGLALGGVTVEARPSLNQFPSNTIPAELATALPSVMPAQRSRTTLTDANGFYSMPVDPGIYDVFAQVPASSGFAWGVTTSHEVLAPTAVLDGGPTATSGSVDIQVPAPVDVTMSLYVPNSSGVVSGALVRAYVAAGPNSTQIQIGQGMTDSNGVLKLLLPPYLP
jgi:hypothetical protein